MKNVCHIFSTDKRVDFLKSAEDETSEMASLIKLKKISKKAIQTKHTISNKIITSSSFRKIDIKFNLENFVQSNDPMTKTKKKFSNFFSTNSF